MGKGIDFQPVDGMDMRIGIVTMRWNYEVVSNFNLRWRMVRARR